MKKAENKYLKIIRWGIFLCAFTPLILHAHMLSIFHFPKVIVFRTIVEIMLIFYVLLIIGNKRYRPNWKNPLLITVTIFTGLYIVTSITGVNPYRSFWGTLERMGGVFSFVHYWIFFVILTSLFKTKDDWIKLFKLCVVAGFLSIIYAYGQYFDWKWAVGWQHGRILGTMGNAALLAGYLIFIIFLAGYLLLTQKNTSNTVGQSKKMQGIQKIEMIFYGLVIVLGALALFLTGVRGSILSFLGALFLLGVFKAITSSKKKITISFLAVLVLLLVCIGVFWLCKDQSWVQENNYLKHVTDISLQTRTVQTRLAAWKSAWQGWQERLWLGWGPENFNLLFAKYFDPMHYEGFGSEVVWDRAHNTLLNTGATMGIVGLLGYLSIFVVLFVYFVRTFKRRAINKFVLAILGIMFIAYFGHNLSFFDTFNSYLMFFIVIGYVSFIHRSHYTPETTPLDAGVKRRGKGASEASINGRRRVAAIVLTPIVFLTIWKTAVIPAKANYAATMGIVYGRSEEGYPIAFDYFRKALGSHPIQGEYIIRHHLARMVFRIFNQTERPEKFGVKNEDLYFALDEVYKNIETDYLDPIPHLYAARLNEFISRIEQEHDIEKARERLDEAERLLDKAVSLNEKNPYIYFELGQVRIFQGKLGEAIEFFERGISVRPEVALGYWYAGVTYLDVGEIEKGEEFIKQAVDREYIKSVNDIFRLVGIYIPLKDYPKIIELYLEAIELEPENAQLYTSLATAHKENGDIDKAIEIARQAIEIDPNLRAEAEAWIRMLENTR